MNSFTFGSLIDEVKRHLKSATDDDRLEQFLTRCFELKETGTEEDDNEEDEYRMILKEIQAALELFKLAKPYIYFSNQTDDKD